MRTRVSISQVRLGPEVALGRRGCKIETSRNIEDIAGWEDTYFSESLKNNQNLQLIYNLIREHGEEVFAVIRRIEFSAEPVKRTNFSNDLQKAIDKIISFKIVNEDSNGCLLLPKPKGDYGSEFECVVQMALENLYIQSKRDVKIRYPYPNQPYDPDGQKYDVLGGLDLTKLIWIECKKPIYLKSSASPLGNVLSETNIRHFYRRAHFLRPSIAVFLVDTIEDYRSILQNTFSPEFLSSGCYSETFSISDQIIARIHGYIYFARITYKTPKEYFPAITQSISQILHDARNDWIEIGFAGNPFKN